MPSIIVPFALRQNVMIVKTGIVGEVTAIGVYSRRGPLVLVEYLTKQGDLREEWFDPEQLLVEI